MELMKKYPDRKRLARALRNHLSHILITSQAGFKYYGLLRTAARLVEEGKMERLPEIDRLLRDIESWDLWD
jgi:hypothetical protein